MKKLVETRKRLEFLKELRERGLEIPQGQIERTENEIKFLEMEIKLESIRRVRDFKISYILN
jgi:hypothetical protein